MGPMRYLLNPAETAFKTAVREFADRLSTAEAGRPGRELNAWLETQRPGGLSRIEAVVALEEIARRWPEAVAGLVSGGPFGSLGAGLFRAAAGIGAAQGLLAEGLARFASDGGKGRSGLQASCDIVTDLEAARLGLYREALLEETGQGGADAAARLERRAEKLAGRARALRDRIANGGEHEARDPLPEGGRSGDGL